MRDIYSPGLDKRIHDFMERKTREYPELRLFEGSGLENHQPTRNNKRYHRQLRPLVN